MKTTLQSEAEPFRPDKIYSVEEYLAIEENSKEKHEFRNGKVTRMPGAKPVNNLIAANIITQLNVALENASANYLVLTSDTRIHIPRFNRFVYPDAVVVCEKIELYPGSSSVIVNPLLIVEVISPSTEYYDKHGKFHEYKQIPGFKEYLLVEQRLPFVLSSFKTAEHLWQDTEAAGLSASILLKSINCTIELRKIYKGVSFNED